MISGDNLSSHDLGGFQKNCSCSNICRYCLVKYFEFRNKLLYNELEIITEENAYRIVKRNFIFSTLNNFHVKYRFPPDLMHDLIEGVIPITIKYSIKNIINKKLTSLELVNNRLKLIDFPLNSSIPKLFKKDILIDGSVIGSASQKFELFLIFPRLFDLNDIKNLPEWDNYILLRSIMDYLYSPIININSLSYLSDLVL